MRNAEDIYNYWEGLHIDDTSRFTKDGRLAVLEELAELCFNQKIPLEDIKDLKRKAIFFLTTEKGRKKQGKHKDGKWTENVEADFDRIIATQYVSNSLSELNLPSRSEKYEDNYIDFQDSIYDWAWEKHKNMTTDFIKECHRINGIFWISFIKDNFYKK